MCLTQPESATRLKISKLHGGALTGQAERGKNGVMIKLAAPVEFGSEHHNARPDPV
ncbi:Uncharacterised protein [Mycobacteroides abscessus subsp. abscessus]|nr:Uncharacterised protein [Mycobacteroides abscessus subsp. abscessus]